MLKLCIKPLDILYFWKEDINLIQDNDYDVACYLLDNGYITHEMAEAIFSALEKEKPQLTGYFL